MKDSNRRARLAPVVVVLAAGAITTLALVVVGVFTSQEASRPTSTEQANLHTVVIPVEGMSCVACAARIKKSLTSIAGVADVEVSLAERNAHVRFDPSRVAPERLVTAINGLGYQAGTPVEAR